MDRELNEQVMIERVEMIARLTTEGTCQERDREIALNLIAEIARGNLIKNNAFTVVFSASPVPERIKKESNVRVNITLDKDQLIADLKEAMLKLQGQNDSLQAQIAAAQTGGNGAKDAKESKPANSK